VTSSPFGPNTLLRTLFSTHVSRRSSLNVSDQASHPYKTTGKIIVLYIKTEWGSRLPPDCFVSSGSFSPCGYYLTWVFTGRVISTSPNPQVRGPPLVGCPRLLIQFIRSYPPYRRPFLHLQPEDAPCRVDRNPLNMVFFFTLTIIRASLLLIYVTETCRS
jgi:hypothetical protein